MIEAYALRDSPIKVDREVTPTSPLIFAALRYHCVERGPRIPRREVSRIALFGMLMGARQRTRYGSESERQSVWGLKTNML